MSGFVPSNLTTFLPSNNSQTSFDVEDINSFSILAVVSLPRLISPFKNPLPLTLMAAVITDGIPRGPAANTTLSSQLVDWLR